MSNFTIRALVLLPCLFLAILFVSGCAPVADFYQGYSVSPDQVVGIAGRDPVKGTVETFEMRIGYDLVRDGNVLRISGQAVLTDRYPLLYGRIPYLNLFLFFVDDQSQVIETVYLANNIGGWPDDRIEFSDSRVIPAGTAGLSFGYRGEALEGSEDHAITEIFYLLPLKCAHPDTKAKT